MGRFYGALMGGDVNGMIPADAWGFNPRALKNHFVVQGALFFSSIKLLFEIFRD